MATGPAIFDRPLIRTRRNRAAEGFAAHDFLKRRAADELADRLRDVTREFPLALDLGSHRGELREPLLETGRIGTLLHADISEAMADHVNGPAAVMDEERLPVADQSLNLVATALSLHTANDLPGALVQIRRALKPDGLFLAAMFGGETLTELRSALADAEAEIEGGVSPRVAPFADVRDMGSLLQRAGFALPVTDTDKLTVTYASALHLLHELRGMGETNALIERRKKPLRRATLFRMAEIYAERFPAEGEPGRIRATFQVVYLTGWAPHESQQKPLKPGSATHRLADALNTEEKSLNEKTAPRRQR